MFNDKHVKMIILSTYPIMILTKLYNKMNTILTMTSDSISDYVVREYSFLFLGRTSDSYPSGVHKTIFGLLFHRYC